jgi:ferric-dicitrate binding protein FerR (iron transport regulator)
LDPLIREALAWVARLKSGEATLGDAEQLMDWRARSQAHESAYREAVRCWQAIGRALVGSRPATGGQRRRKTRVREKRPSQ